MENHLFQELFQIVLEYLLFLRWVQQVVGVYHVLRGLQGKV
jgi:hypothetical protein